MSLKHFTVDALRHELVVDVEFYQMNLTSIVDLARSADPEIFVQDGVFLPSWTKFSSNPVKAKGFFANMLGAVFNGKNGIDELNVDYQTRRKPKKEGLKVAMMWLPGSMTNDNLGDASVIASESLDGFVVQAIYGEEMTNGTAESKCKEVIEKAFAKNQNVLFLSSRMAARSFSIPEITELYLAYDTGDNGATIQKMSRTLTPHRVGKVGRVISLSFDPNRDDKFDAMLIETAQNYKKNKGIADLKTALRDVLRTVDIFRCQQNGAVKVEVDAYLEEALARNSVDRVVGKIAPINELTAAQIHALSLGKAEVFRAATKAAAQRGKTSLSTAKSNKGVSKIDASAKEIAKAREVIVTIAQNIDIIKYYGGSTIDEAFAIMDAEGDAIQDDVTEQFGVDYELIKDLVLGGIINRDLLDLKFANA